MLCCALSAMLGSQCTLQRPSSGWTVRSVVHGCIATVLSKTTVFHADIPVNCVLVLSDLLAYVLVSSILLCGPFLCDIHAHVLLSCIAM